MQSWRLEAARKARLQECLADAENTLQQRDKAVQQLAAEKAKTAELIAQAKHVATIHGDLQDVWVGMVDTLEDQLQVGCSWIVPSAPKLSQQQGSTGTEQDPLLLASFHTSGRLD